MAEEINEPSYSEEQRTEWDPGWLPIAGDTGGGMLLADLSQPGSDQVPVLTFFWDDGVRQQSASIADAVGVWIDVLESHAVWLPDKGRWETRFAEVPIPQRHLI
jgi:cell wall assembly regulator SMI1